ncbi:MAG: prepilin-type N-terminal cleavage/methylation domain-containing protein [Armatimonadetes bacterium]|nr:prepilin-type N-terminal cleavage/methylation domain-containing protein [Armatimonadota bacterium]
MLMKRNNAFTLIELLVVIAIIAILAAILFPVFTQAKAAAKKTTDISNFKQQGIAMAMYTGDSDGGLPMSNTGGLCSQVRGWGFGPPDSVPAQTMQPYMKNFQVTVCPNDSFSLQQRLVDHQPNWPSGHTIATATQAEKDYAYGVRSNIGYNYEFLSPVLTFRAFRVGVSVTPLQHNCIRQCYLGSTCRKRRANRWRKLGRRDSMLERSCW